MGGLKNVHLITRNQEHLTGLKEKGATIVCTAEGDKELKGKVTALSPQEMQGKYDVVFLMTKQKNNEEIARFLLPYLHENSVVCTTQNGLPEEGLSLVLGNERVYGAATSYGATFIGGGKMALTSKFEGMAMEVGGYYNDGSKIGLLVEILSCAGKAVGKEDFARGTDNLLGARWSKLAINAAFSGLSVVTGLTFGEISRKRKTRKLALKILRECFFVAEETGVELAEMQGHNMKKLLGGKSFFGKLFAYAILPIAMKKHKKLRSGMLNDIQKGRKCEIDLINGAVVKAGEKVNVPTPVCERVVELVHGIENGLYEISYKNTDFF
jgi:2-dehydropantoate 2-reductase